MRAGINGNHRRFGFGASASSPFTAATAAERDDRGERERERAPVVAAGEEEQ